MDVDYKEMFSKAKAKLETLQAQKANLEELVTKVNSQIEAMTQTVNAIAPIIGESPVPTLKTLLPPGTSMLQAAGITVAIKTLLDRRANEDFSAPMIRDALQEQGWSWTNYVNPLSAIHTVLKRLLESGVIKEYTGILPVGSGRRYHSASREALEGLTATVTRQFMELKDKK
jgi:hypothetical protein